MNLVNNFRILKIIMSLTFFYLLLYGDTFTTGIVCYLCRAQSGLWAAYIKDRQRILNRSFSILYIGLCVGRLYRGGSRNLKGGVEFESG